MKSMTGYGTGEFKGKYKQFSFEVKTVNHRFCEVNLRLPPRFYHFEGELTEFTKKHFKRGRIDIFIRESGSNNRGRVRIDESQLEHYLKVMQKFNKKLKSKETPRLEYLLNLPHVVILEDNEEDLKVLLNHFKKTLSTVFEKVEKMREKEGEGVRKDLEFRLDLIKNHVQIIEQKIPEIISDYQSRLKDRIEKLSQQSPDEWRLAQEVAYFVDRTDVAEELQRLESHLKHFKEVTKEKDAVGRKLDFILQEINREINTLGAKSQHSETSKQVVACKHELEKMREQVQNVE